MFPAALIQVFFVLLIAGVLLWAVSAIPVLDATIKQFIRIAVIVIVAIWLIYVLMGMFGAGFPAMRR